MKRLSTILSVLLVVVTVLSFANLTTTHPQAKKLVIYMQMGGDAGAPSVLARTNGARAAEIGRAHV